jgi:hypothetical protein
MGDDSYVRYDRYILDRGREKLMVFGERLDMMVLNR